MGRSARHFRVSVAAELASAQGYTEMLDDRMIRIGVAHAAISGGASCTMRRGG